MALLGKRPNFEQNFNYFKVELLNQIKNFVFNFFLHLKLKVQMK